jgi:hypothetical protein
MSEPPEPPPSVPGLGRRAVAHDQAAQLQLVAAVSGPPS